MKKLALPICLLIVAAITIQAQQTDFPKLTGPYLGQKPPGLTPEIFAPRIVSTRVDEYALEISGDGNEIVFMRGTRIMLITRDADGLWKAPAVAPFSGRFIDDEPCFSPDGKRVYFMSRRPCPGSRRPANLWAANREGNAWGEPIPVKQINQFKALHAPSVAANGNIYDDGLTRFRTVNGNYQPGEEVLPRSKGMWPYVSPDERYILYAAKVPGRWDFDLFLWKTDPRPGERQPIRLPDSINSPAIEGNSFVTADGKYLFFSRNFDIYWVSTEIIEELRTKE